MSTETYQWWDVDSASRGNDTDQVNDATQANLGNGTAVATWTATSGTDVGYAAGTLDASYADSTDAAVVSGTTAFAVGTHTLTATLKDDSLNSRDRDFTVKVADTVIPAQSLWSTHTNANVVPDNNQSNNAIQDTPGK